MTTKTCSIIDQYVIVKVVFPKLMYFHAMNTLFILRKTSFIFWSLFSATNNFIVVVNSSVLMKIKLIILNRTLFVIYSFFSIGYGTVVPKQAAVKTDCV